MSWVDHKTESHHWIRTRGDTLAFTVVRYYKDRIDHHCGQVSHRLLVNIEVEGDVPQHVKNGLRAEMCLGSPSGAQSIINRYIRETESTHEYRRY